jgi:hypothetical protein
MSEQNKQQTNLSVLGGACESDLRVLLKLVPTNTAGILLLDKITDRYTNLDEAPVVGEDVDETGVDMDLGLFDINTPHISNDCYGDSGRCYWLIGSQPEGQDSIAQIQKWAMNQDIKMWGWCCSEENDEVGSFNRWIRAPMEWDSNDYLQWIIEAGKWMGKKHLDKQHHLVACLGPQPQGYFDDWLAQPGRNYIDARIDLERHLEKCDGFCD